MLVITRNMSRNMQPVVKPVAKPVARPVAKNEITPYNQIVLIDSFKIHIRGMLKQYEEMKGGDAQLIQFCNICLYINFNLPNIMYFNIPEWNKFAATVYNKIIEFEQKFNTYEYQHLNKVLVKQFYDVTSQTKHMASYLLRINKYVWTPLTFEKRPRRNVPKVDYTGMDCIEPLNEYDGITNIWEDKSIAYDSDYVEE